MEGSTGHGGEGENRSCEGENRSHLSVVIVIVIEDDGHDITTRKQDREVEKNLTEMDKNPSEAWNCFFGCAFNHFLSNYANYQHISQV